MSAIPLSPDGDPSMLLDSDGKVFTPYHQMLSLLGRHLEDLGSILVAHSHVKGAALDLLVGPSTPCCDLRFMSNRSQSTNAKSWVRSAGVSSSYNNKIDPKTLEVARRELHESLGTVKEQLQTVALLGEKNSPPPPSPWLFDPALFGRGHIVKGNGVVHAMKSPLQTPTADTDAFKQVSIEKKECESSRSKSVSILPTADSSSTMQSHHPSKAIEPYTGNLKKNSSNGDLDVEPLISGTLQQNLERNLSALSLEQTMSSEPSERKMSAEISERKMSSERSEQNMSAEGSERKISAEGSIFGEASTVVQNNSRFSPDTTMPKSKRRARNLTSQNKGFTELKVWQIDGWEQPSRGHSTIGSLHSGSANDRNFHQIVRLLHEQKGKRRSGFTTLQKLLSPLQPFIVSPISRFSIALDVTALVLIVGDCVAVPMFLLETGQPIDHILLSIMFWIARIFWTLSIPRVFLTGYMREDGAMEMNAAKIAKEYCNTWLLLDLVIVVTDWLYASSGGMSRIFRILKGARLARMVRIPQWVVLKMNHGKSEIMLLYLKIIKDTLTFLMLNHFLACTWFFIGTVSDDSGWVRIVGVYDASIAEKYTFSIHWSTSQFIGSSEVMPKSKLERGFGALVMIFAFIWSASFISGITAAMTRLQILSGQKGMLLSSLRQFLSNNSISEHLAMRVIASAKFLVAEKENSQSEADVELLHILSEPMLIEIHYEINSTILTQHPFFWRYNHYEPSAIQNVCHSAIRHLTLAVGDTVFSQGVEPIDPNMFFILSGTLLYFRDFDGDGTIELDEMVRVSPPRWVCEPVLWMKWAHAGTLRSAMNCSVLALSAEKFRSIVSEYRNTLYPAEYATQLVAMMNLAYQADDVDDLCENINTADLVSQVFPHLLSKSKNRAFTMGLSSFAKSQSSMGSRFFGRSASHGTNAGRALRLSFLG